MRKNFIREKKILCGEQYREVDIFPYTRNQKRATKGKRAKKEKVSAPKQKNLNDKNARRYFTQLTNLNFGEGDLHVTTTYKNKFLPKTVEEAEKTNDKFLRRIKYRREKEGLPPLKYIVVTEYITKKGDDKPVRIHHHIIMNGGLDRDTVEDIWRMRRKKGEKKGEKIGYINADRLQPEESGVAALCEYLKKRPNGKKRWRSSLNLQKPESRNNDNRYNSRRQIEKMAKNPPDISYWEKMYKGWTLTDKDYGVQFEYNEVTASWSIYLKLRRKEVQRE